MRSLRFEIAYDSPAEEVLDAFWDAASWPEVAPHVRAVEIHYEGHGVQVLSMRVVTGGRSDAFRSIRVREGRSIFFFQPAPPPALRRHLGWWRIREAPGGSLVACEHWYQTDPAGARAFLRAAGTSDRDPDPAIGEVLTANSRQTMLALRDRLRARVRATVPGS